MTKRKKIGLIFTSLVAALLITYLCGPKVRFEPVNFATAPVTETLFSLDSVIAARERLVADLKPENEARIVWADTTGRKTDYAVVYIHGYSASQMEGHPIHRDFARRYGCNLYLARLEDHGRADTNSFRDLTPDALFESAQRALEIGKKLGEKVIVMSCSTGSTLAIMLTQVNPDIYGHIMYAPNIDIRDPLSALVTEPWGAQLLSFVLKGDHNHITYTPEAQKYWNAVYHKNGIIVTKRLIKDYMTDAHFAKINQPLFLAYFYRDEDHQDNAVSVPRMLDFFEAVSTPPAQKRKYASGTADSHVVSSYVQSKDVEGVKRETFRFAEEVLKLTPVTHTH
ncbi:MAG: alpha/beta hydrolase [Saprospiraceae bacterium]|nr:alpha/beta hydrolase [Saprospiraceae bacterium]